MESRVSSAMNSKNSSNLKISFKALTGVGVIQFSCGYVAENVLVIYLNFRC